MAFCAKVDSDGNEIERIVISGRSSNSDTSHSSSLRSITETESETLKNVSTRTYTKLPKGTYVNAFAKGKKYNNSAHFSESSTGSNASSHDEEQSSELDEQTGTGTGTDNTSWTGSTTALSHTGTYDLRSESRSNIVPSLDLRSDTQSSNFVKRIESVKMGPQQHAAYESWLSKKIKNMSSKQQQTKKQREELERQKQERARLSQERYEQWLKQKAQREQQRYARPKEIKPKEKSSPKISEYSESSEYEREEAQRRRNNWEIKKRQAELERQQKRRQEEQQRRELEEKRKEMSRIAWENWIAEAAKKPKPVPLNQGMKTLRGTVSNIFINPNEWKPIIESTEEECA